MNPNSAIPGRAGSATLALPKWLLLSLALAVLYLASASFLVFLCGRVLHSYKEAAAENQYLAKRHELYAELGDLAAAANAPGNDIFKSGDVASETARFESAWFRFTQRLAEMRSSVPTSLPENRRPYFEQALNSIAAEQTNMAADARALLSLYANGQIPAATDRMTSMDAHYGKTLALITHAYHDVQNAQVAALNRQAAFGGVVQSRVHAMVLVVFAVVVAAVFYSIVLARRMRAQEREKQVAFECLRHAEEGLRESNDELEARVRERTRELENANTKLQVEVKDRLLAEAAVRKSEQKFRGILESAPDAIVIVNQAGRIALVNSQAENLFGHSRSEMEGQLMEMLIPERYRAQHPAHRESYFTDAHTRPMGVGLDLVAVTKDGREFPVEVSLSPLRTDEGILVSSAIRNITDRKKVERALQEKNQELSRANKAKDNFLASMSHELRTPLNGIIGFAEFLSDGKPGAVNVKQKEYLQDILNNGRHLLHLINDMLDLVKIQADKLELNPETFQLQDAVDEACAGVRPIAQNKQIEVRVKIAAGLEMVTLDPQRFKQILYNLLSNALKFTDNNGKVEIKAEPDGAGRFRLSIRDTGIGIKSEDIKRLFTEFEQLESGTARRFGGTGLGLALTRKIVEMTGGAISVESEVAKGSTFSVVLPLSISNKNP